jgi:hypothetical protein
MGISLLEAVREAQLVMRGQRHRIRSSLLTPWGCGGHTSFRGLRRPCYVVLTTTLEHADYTGHADTDYTRLPHCPSQGASLVARSPIPCPLRYVRGVPHGLMIWSKAPDHARAFGHPGPHSGSLTRRHVALPRSRVPLVKTCPALRPRWCPAHSPKRTQDCCLPATANRRLTTTLSLSGLHHAAYLLATPGSVRPLTGRHAGSLLTCWLGFSQVGLAP